jgi:tRNA (cmo5U34)-methyltransferase
MLEKMDACFEARLVGYDDHMLTEIEGAAEFYPATAALLPEASGAKVLDLGCGTGLELQFYFDENPTAKVTGIDLSAAMLGALKEKFPGRELQLVQGSYFEVALGDGYDAAVSVESLHHFTQEQKTGLYAKLHAALKDGGYFVLTDYFAPDDAYEQFYFNELHRLKHEQGIADNAFYHYDTPLTVAHETQALLDAGFSRVEEIRCWGATHILKAYK